MLSSSQLLTWQRRCRGEFVPQQCKLAFVLYRMSQFATELQSRWEEFTSGICISSPARTSAPQRVPDSHSRLQVLHRNAETQVRSMQWKVAAPLPAARLAASAGQRYFRLLFSRHNNHSGRQTYGGNHFIQFAREQHAPLMWARWRTPVSRTESRCSFSSTGCWQPRPRSTYKTTKYVQHVQVLFV